MFSSYEQRARQRGIDSINEFETFHGRPDKSPTPLARYNPKKAMKQAEKEYLASRGIVKKSLFKRIKEAFLKQ